MTRKRALLITVLVLLVASVVTASIMLSGKRATEPSPGASLGTNAEGFEISPVKAGEGGTKMGPDGVTPIGYPPTCEGAYAAAINYRKTEQTADRNWQETQQTLEFIYTVPIAADSLEKLMQENGVNDYLSSDVRTLGIFKPLNCEAGKHAEVVVSDVTVFKNFPDTEPYVLVQAGPAELLWTNGDWKRVPSYTGDATETLSLQLQMDTAPAITKEIIDALFTADDGHSISREGWKVVNNATR
ncbi:hypothetical protein [Paeniglutamicibacter sp. NPDC091659]|uniref:hypothetical protein n=1 Tax=Paeniglutamicibacter sp. NPDC091659 TaxID=3364389 RepID=UPI00382D5729